MSKYIIKNCPAILKCKYGNCCIEPENTEYTKQICEDFSDCLLKQIVEKCEKAIKTYENEEFYEDDCDRFLGECSMARDILELLDIDEVLND